MSFEQIEGHLAELEDKTVGVILPIRGSVFVTYCGKLIINHVWDNHSIYYSLRFYPDTAINFEAHDVEKIIKKKDNDELESTIVLKSDAPMQQFSYHLH